MTRIAVVGAGAIGTWLGGALARAGNDVVLLGRSGAVRETVEVRDGGSGNSYTAAARLTSAVDAVGDAEVAFLCVKAHDQAVAGCSLPPGVPVVAVQNGIPWWYFHPEAQRVEAADPGGAVSAVIDPARAIGCVAYLGATLIEPGVVVTRPEAGLVIGEPSRGPSSRLDGVAALLREAGFDVRVEEDVRVEIWTKLMGNASFNPISMLTRAGLGTIATDPPARALVASIMREVVAIAGAYGVAPVIDIEARLAITERLGDHKTSTLQDVEAGRPPELSALVHAPLELAAAAGIDAPALRTVAALAALSAR